MNLNWGAWFAGLISAVATGIVTIIGVMAAYGEPPKNWWAWVILSLPAGKAFWDYIKQTPPPIGKVVGVILVFFLLMGCAQTIQFTQEVAQTNLQRVEAEKIIAANFQITYCTWDGPKIRALLGPDINKLPGEIKAQMDELDVLCKAVPVDLPKWWGLYQRYAISIVLEAIKKYVPEVFGQITRFMAIGAGV